MAVNFGSSGDRFADLAGGCVPKRYAVARYTLPAVGNLCKMDTTAAFNDGVVRCAAADIPEYMIRSVNSTNGTLSVWIVTRCIQLVFPYLGSPALKQQIQMNDPAIAATIPIGGVLRDVVKGVASGGVAGSKIVNIDGPGTGLLVVEFGGAS